MTDTYFVIPIRKEQRKYLCFAWKSALLEFACHPFKLWSKMEGKFRINCLELLVCAITVKSFTKD